MQQELIVGSRADSAVDVIAGSKQYPCANCGGAVWIAPTGQRMVAAGYTVVCMPCARAAVEQTEDVEVKLAPLAIEEVRDHLLTRGRKG